MTHEEVYQELARDRESMTRWWWHQRNDLKRPMLKSRTFPRYVWRDYTSPRKNRYLLFTRIFDRHMKTILTSIAAIRLTQEGMTTYTNWLGDYKLIKPMVLIPHMWKRYAERTGTDKTGIELLKHYLEHNPYGKDSNNQHVVGRSVRYNGEDHLSSCVTEGVLLGQQRGDMFIVKTFITYDMCCGRQSEEFECCRNQILTDKEIYKQAKRFYI